ncbi:MAG: GerMN domain-containing protein [Candidatus Dojkabacteria bacterium]
MAGKKTAKETEKTDQPKILRTQAYFLLVVAMIVSAVLSSILTQALLAGDQSTGTEQPVPADTDTTVSITPTPTAEGRVPEKEAGHTVEGEFNIYFTSIGDFGASGEQIGCGDSLVGVVVPIKYTREPITRAITELLSYKTPNFGQTGLYTALYNSILKIESVEIKDRTAIVKLSGIFKLGDDCDGPRFREQLKSTVLQFEWVDSARIYINNKKIEKLFK